MKYYILYKEENRGPLEIEELEQYDLNPKSRVWAPGWSAWQDADEVPEFQAYFTKREEETRKRQAQAKAEALENQRKQQEEAMRSAQTQTAAQVQASSQHNNQGLNPPPAYIPNSSDGIEWWIDINNSQVGPLKTEELLSQGLTPDTLVWFDKMSDWAPAKTVVELQSLLPPVTTPSGSTPNISSTSYPDLELSTNNKFTGAIISCIATIAVIAVSVLKAEYYDIDEICMLAGYCAGGSLILSIVSLLMAKAGATAEFNADYANSLKKSGLSLGLAIGGIISAIVGIMIALNDFNIS